MGTTHNSTKEYQSLILFPPFAIKTPSPNGLFEKNVLKVKFQPR